MDRAVFILHMKPARPAAIYARMVGIDVYNAEAYKYRGADPADSPRV